MFVLQAVQTGPCLPAAACLQRQAGRGAVCHEDILSPCPCAFLQVHLLPGKTHTDLLLEDALGGGRDVLTDSILQCITGQQQCSNHPSMCPRLLVSLASKVCPF